MACTWTSVPLPLALLCTFIISYFRCILLFFCPEISSCLPLHTNFYVFCFSFVPHFLPASLYTLISMYFAFLLSRNVFLPPFTHQFRCILLSFCLEISSCLPLHINFDVFCFPFGPKFLPASLYTLTSMYFAFLLARRFLPAILYTPISRQNCFRPTPSGF
jgi:hypothetical protein